MDDETRTGVEELVVLSKFEGDPDPENEFERISIQNGVVVSHDRIENGDVVGPVEDSDILGADIGRLMSQQEGVN
jgi:hypothetical protein